MSLAIRPNQDEYSNLQNMQKKIDGKDNGTQPSQNVDGSSLNLCGDADSEKESKHNLAKKQAMKLISDAWSRTMGMLEEKDAVSSEKSKAVSEYHQLKNQLQDIECDKENLQKEYGIDSDSREQKDLELLEKYQDNKNGAFMDSFSEEEIERLKELQGKPLTEYQKKALKMNAAKDSVYMEMERKKSEMISLTGEISDLKTEMLKSNDLENARGAAEQIMDASNQELLAIMLKEGKDHLEETAEEEQEKAKENAEKKEEQDEALEKAKDERLAEEELIQGELEADKLKHGIANRRINDSRIEEAQKGIQKILEENHLINEDIKGIEIDFNF